MLHMEKGDYVAVQGNPWECGIDNYHLIFD